MKCPLRKETIYHYSDSILIGTEESPLECIGPECFAYEPQINNPLGDNHPPSQKEDCRMMRERRV